MLGFFFFSSMWMLLPKKVKTITKWITNGFKHKVRDPDRCRFTGLFTRTAANHIWSLDCSPLQSHQNTGRDQNNLITRIKMWFGSSSLAWMASSDMHFLHLPKGKVSTNLSKHNGPDWLSIFVMMSNYPSNTASFPSQRTLKLDYVRLSKRPWHSSFII